MHFQKGSVHVIPEAVLESLGHGLFNSPDAYQIEVLSELDFLNEFVTIRDLVRQKISRAVNIFASLLSLNEAPLAAALLKALEADEQISTEKLHHLLSRRKLSRGSKPILERLNTIQPRQINENSDLELKYLRQALTDTVHDYRETKVGHNLMQVCFLMPKETRQSLWQELQAEELYLLSSYIKDPQVYALYLAEVPCKYLPGIVHEMKKNERSFFLALLLQNSERDLECLKQALKGLYHMPEGVGEISDVRPLSDQGHFLRKVFEKETLNIHAISPQKLAHVVSILLQDDEDRGICSIFKRQEMTREQLLAVDERFKQGAEKAGSGLKRLIETIHDHEGLFSLSTTTSKAYPIMQELKRLNLNELLNICQDARP